MRIRPPGEPDELVTEHPARIVAALLDEAGVGEVRSVRVTVEPGKTGDACELGSRRARGPVGHSMEEPDGAGE